MKQALALMNKFGPVVKVDDPVPGTLDRDVFRLELPRHYVYAAYPVGRPWRHDDFWYYLRDYPEHDCYARSLISVLRYLLPGTRDIPVTFEGRQVTVRISVEYDPWVRPLWGVRINGVGYYGSWIQSKHNLSLDPDLLELLPVAYERGEAFALLDRMAEHDPAKVKYAVYYGTVSPLP